MAGRGGSPLRAIAGRDRSTRVAEAYVADRALASGLRSTHVVLSSRAAASLSARPDSRTHVRSGYRTFVRRTLPPGSTHCPRSAFDTRRTHARTLRPLLHSMLSGTQ